MLAFLKDQGGIYNEETTKGLAQILLIAAVRDFDEFFFHQWERLFQLHPRESLLRAGARCLFVPKKEFVLILSHSTDIPFWVPEPPKPFQFDPDDPLHIQFIFDSMVLTAHMFGFDVDSLLQFVCLDDIYAMTHSPSFKWTRIQSGEFIYQRCSLYNFLSKDTTFSEIEIPLLRIQSSHGDMKNHPFHPFPKRRR